MDSVHPSSAAGSEEPPSFSEDPKAYFRAYYYARRAELCARATAYQNSHPEQTREAQRRKRARQKAAGGSLYPAQWAALKAHYGHRCLACGTHESDTMLTADHVVPLLHGGRNDVFNRQPLCRPCNSAKRTHVIDYRPDADTIVETIAHMTGPVGHRGVLPGHVQSAETRARIGNAHRGVKDGPPSEETRRKLSARLTGRERSAAHRAHNGAATRAFYRDHVHPLTGQVTPRSSSGVYGVMWSAKERKWVVRLPFIDEHGTKRCKRFGSFANLAEATHFAARTREDLGDHDYERWQRDHKADGGNAR